MATLTPLQKRAARMSRNKTGLDMNLVALIDVFTILIFFLLSNATGVDILPSTKDVQLPMSNARTLPTETLVVAISAQDILVGKRPVAKVADVMASPDDLIVPLQAELTLQQSQRPVVNADKADQARTITIMGDKSIPYQLLRKVMVSCAQAGFADVRFAVRERDGA
jgi:biopolymer transport protein ExbD